jgi:hypothetical protein
MNAMTKTTWMIMVMLLAGAATGAVADISGRWRAEFPGPGGTVGEETLELVVTGSVVTGTLTNAVGGVGPIRDGKWDGASLQFWVEWDSDDRLVASGTLVGPNLELDLSTRQWKSRRVFKPLPRPQ